MVSLIIEVALLNRYGPLTEKGTFHLVSVKHPRHILSSPLATGVANRCALRVSDNDKVPLKTIPTKQPELPVSCHWWSAGLLWRKLRAVTHHSSFCLSIGSADKRAFPFDCLIRSQI